MANISKKIKRDKEKAAKKELKKKMGLFNKLPPECLVCQKAFNKKDKEMVMTWSVVVRNDINEVRLYCPQCWDFAHTLIKEYENGSSDTKDNV